MTSQSVAVDTSVILVVRNGADYIADAITSVLDGTRIPREIVVIDGHSTDHTVAIASRFERVVVFTQASRGIAAAYNEGIAKARGERLAFISHDDRWTPDKLERQSALLDAQSATWGCVGHVQHFLADGATPPAGFRTSLLDAPVPGFIMESLLVRGEIFRQVGLFDESIPSAHDTDWFARARDAGIDIALLSETVLHKRVHGTNASITDGHLNGQLLRALRASINRKRGGESAATA